MEDSKKCNAKHVSPPGSLVKRNETMKIPDINDMFLLRKINVNM
jgi:hypothetical protein